MKNRRAVLAGLIGIALVAAPVSPAFAWGQHGGHFHGGYYGGGPIWGLAGAVAATAAAIITLPIAILASAAQAPLYYGPGPAGYPGPAAGSGDFGPAPAYYGASPAPYAAPAPAYYARPATYYAPPPAYYPPRAVGAYYGAPQGYYAPRPAYYAPPPAYYAPRVSQYAAPPAPSYYNPR